jgi:hypothetical protein
MPVLKEQESVDEDFIDPVYLRFTFAQLNSCFLPVKGGGRPDRHLKHYRDSKTARELHKKALADPSLDEDRRAAVLGKQMEKDERFWVASALMTLYFSTDRVANFSNLLSKCLGPTPPMDEFGTWAEALGECKDLELYFEVNLPVPCKYKEAGTAQLERHLVDRVLSVPHLLEAAANASKRGSLEGTTKVDAVLISGTTNFAVLFEAKVLSDISTHTNYDAMRNQMIRNIDVMLDSNPRVEEPLKSRDPDKTCFVLLTPEVFRGKSVDSIERKSRLYGWLFDEYAKEHGSLLSEHLPHRSGEDLSSVPSRLGWLTWEECNEIDEGACPWLDRATY